MRPEPSVQKIFGEFPYATLVEEIHDFAIFLIDLEGRVCSWNEGAVNLFGYRKDEIVGRAASELLVPEDRAEGPRREVETALVQGRAESSRWHLRKDGSRFWGSGVMSVLQGDTSEPLGFTKVLRDDTAHRRVEEELSRTADQLQRALDVGRIGTWRWDIPADRVNADANLARFFGVAPDIAAGGPVRHYTNAVHPADSERVMAAIQESIVSGAPYSEDFRILQPDGSVFWVEARGLIERDAAGAAQQLNGVMVDISERKEVEAELRLSEERYSTLFEAIDNGFCVIDMLFDENGRAFDYRFVEVNPAFEKQTGFTDPVGKTMRSFVPNLEESWFQTYGQVALTGESIHFESAADAMQRFYEVHAFRVGAPQDHRIAILFNDITARRQGEARREELVQQLEFERRRLAEIFHSAPAFVAVLRGPDHVFEMANPAYYQLVGHRDILGKPLFEALPEIADQGFIELLDKVRLSGEAFEGREMVATLQREPGGASEERFVDLLYQPLIEADGTVSGVFSHGVDITEQVRARRAAETANRVKDEFLATLSHELRTPLTAILGWVSILQTGTLSPEETRRGLETIERNSRAQSQLIEDILDVSRVITGKLRLEVRPIELTDIIEEAVATLTPAAAAKQIRLQRVLDAGASIVSGDSTRLGQVVWNLLSNAIKFTPRGGRVQVRLERINSHVEIIVSDTGAGIAPDVLPHVFERFRQADSTTTRSHGGLGLGLAIVRHLVELHGGSVEAHSAGLGTGAEFTVKLPLVALRASDRRGDAERVHPTLSAAAQPGAAPATLRLDGLHVLLVDDQEDTRFLLSVFLERCGARVTAESSAEGAFQALKHERPDVLISDIGMPGEDGFSLIKRVRALPASEGGQTPAAALTAFARVEDRVKVLQSGFQIHLPKPIEPTELATVVANLAGRRGES